jgi:hypothetical protein
MTAWLRPLVDGLPQSYIVHMLCVSDNRTGVGYAFLHDFDDRRDCSPAEYKIRRGASPAGTGRLGAEAVEVGLVRTTNRPLLTQIDTPWHS